MNEGDLVLRNATLNDNVADLNGGGIANSGTMALNNTTFSGNQAANFIDVWNTGTCTGCPP